MEPVRAEWLPDQVYVLALAPAVTATSEASQPAKVILKSELVLQVQDLHQGKGSATSPASSLGGDPNPPCLLREARLENVAPVVKGSLSLSWSERYNDNRHQEPACVWSQTSIHCLHLCSK